MKRIVGLLVTVILVSCSRVNWSKHRDYSRKRINSAEASPGFNEAGNC